MEKKKTDRDIKAWIVLAVVYLASITVTMSLMKIPPLMGILIADLHTSTTVGGLFMSAFMMAGVILAIPAASLLDRWGPKKSGLASLVFTICGSVLGSFSYGSPLVLLIGRFIEGIGFGGMMVIAPAVISMWFEPEKRGLPMGIWATWVPIGLFIMYNIAQPLESLFNWRIVWWFNGAFALLVLLLYWVVVDYPDGMKKGAEEAEAAPYSGVKLHSGLRNVNTWLLTGIFFIYGMTVQGYTTWLPTDLVESGIFPPMANFYSSLITMGRIPGIILAGFILGFAKKHQTILGFGLTLAVVVFGLWFLIGDISHVVFWMVALGLSTGLAPTTIFTLTTETASRPELIGIALALVNMGFNTGQIIGPPVIGMIIGRGSWVPVYYFILIPLFISAVLALQIRMEKDEHL